MKVKFRKIVTTVCSHYLVNSEHIQYSLFYALNTVTGGMVHGLLKDFSRPWVMMILLASQCFIRHRYNSVLRRALPSSVRILI